MLVTVYEGACEPGVAAFVVVDAMPCVVEWPDPAI